MVFLIIDDSQSTRHLLSHHLVRLGHECHEASCGPEALAFLAAGRSADLILLDYSMPHMDGIETFTEIRKGWPLIPVVMMTANESTQLAVEFMRSGGDMFVLKPFNLDLLELVMREVLEKARFRREAAAAQRDLEESEALFRAIVEGESLIGTYMLKASDAGSWRLVYASPKFAEIAGHPEVDLQAGRDVADLVADADRPALAATLQARFAGESTAVPLIVSLKRHDETLTPVQINAGLARFKGEPVIIGTVRSLTAEQEAGARARKAELARSLAEKASAAKSAFLANVSHELRTPLTAILGFADQAEHDLAAADFERTKRDIARIVANAERLADTIEGVLDLSRIEANCGDYAFAPQSLAKLTRSAARDLEPLASRRGLRIAITDELPEGHLQACDAKHMGRVVVNLLANAIKFADLDSEIGVRLWREPNGVCLSVADRGTDIPSEEIEHIFEPFVQSSRTDQGAGGTGLGLALCRRIVGAHGGTIAARSNPDAGVVFTVRLPEFPLHQSRMEEAAS